MIRKVTHATMIQTDGTRTVYGIFLSTLHYDLSARPDFINIHRSKHIASVECVNERSGHPDPSLVAGFYRALASLYATQDAPAFSW